MTDNVLIETDRLFIRSPEEGDIEPLNLVINRSLSELQRWMPWAHDPSLKATRKFVRTAIKQLKSKKQPDLPLIVVLKSNREIIAATGYNDRSDLEVPFCEIGYWLDTQCTGQGYATEFTAALTKLAFSYFGAIRVQIKTQEQNKKSQAVAERCGYILEACLKNYCKDCLTGEPRNSFVYSMFSMDQLKVNPTVIVHSI
ncbi:GNAT family N-acetyltransferase [Legionella waltersii]|uniref:Ribosomal-protein-serine acetyltransferase n=1 Tax=Legionella waltersii TaxID=66969 RepID=A0A0W1ABS0_9GAMM|nr:GNAT family protein [Legionella waltersii]KTD78812.1 Ribosomal-protein-serine acetyltransferase [Legionella waltersii]SNV11015.1 GNAT family acetyltransferase [Legionella waltersii]